MRSNHDSGAPVAPTYAEFVSWCRNRAVGSRLYMSRTGEPLHRCAEAMADAERGPLPDPFHEAMLAESRRQPHILIQTARDALTALRAAGSAAGQAYLDEALQVALQAAEDLAVEVQRSRL